MTRGRGAETPVQIPVTGWLDIAWRIKDRFASNRVSLVAASVAFYGLLALFPAIGAVLAIGGLAVDPKTTVEQMVDFKGVVPPRSILRWHGDTRTSSLTRTCSRRRAAYSLNVV